MRSEFISTHQKLNSEPSFNFSSLNSFVDNWMPSLQEDTKFELIMPLCFESSTTISDNDSIISKFDNFLSSVFEALTPTSYNQNIIYNQAFFEEGEQLT
mmetsp:Transcript_37405/g.27596  ORF Transcript_37405/g.27596 Transcript_37405/m.27596 type:complete len:99 (+) Transcript_37405:398-694(+)